MPVQVRRDKKQFNRIFPVNATAKLRMQLKEPYHSTFRSEDLVTIKLLGFEVEFVQ